MKRLLLCCLLPFLGSQIILAETFVVTSTLAQGAGSLREALEKAAANGTATPDLIVFNITRARDLEIKIAINNLLPAVTDNVTIDGTTQPGATLGASDAKLGISLEGFYTGSDLLYLLDLRTARNVKIFGLFLKGNVVHPLTGAKPTKFYGILLEGSQSIQIGAPGQGNVISGWSSGIYDEFNGRSGRVNGVWISSNIFGLDTDGVSLSYGGRTGGTATNTYSITFKGNCDWVTIGGDQPTEGNIFNSSNTDIYASGQADSDGTFTVKNNKFGIGIDDRNLQSNTTTAIDVSSMHAFPNYIATLATPVIENNYIGGQRRNNGIVGKNLLMHFSIANNIIGFEDRSGLPDRDAFYGRAIFIDLAHQATIRKNIIRYWSQGAIILNNTYSLRITENSTYCNKTRAIELRNWGPLTNPPTRRQPYAYINRIEPARGIVSGTSLPDNTIELFYNDNCPTCEGKTHFATVQADRNGDWRYTGPLTGNNVIATATEIYFATSEYSMPEIDTTALQVNPVTCASALGSICGLKIKSGTKWRWEDASGNVVGYDTCLKQVPAGRYFFKLSIGSSCEESFAFNIPDASPIIDASNATITAARCGGPNGRICGLIVRNGVSVRWEDATGNTVSSNLCFNTARPGRYRLRLEGQQNCIIYSSVFEVPDKVPAVNAANAAIVHPSCGNNNGSITGMQVTDAEFATAGWYNEAGALVSSGLNLRNAAPGRYKFVVKDNSGACGDSTAYYTLNLVPPPGMSTAGAQVTDATCGRNNGSITGITLSNTTGTVNYWWTDQTGSVIATTADLLNVSPGTYRLKVKDGSSCDTLRSPVYSVVDRGSVQLDSSAVTISPTGCNKVTGSIIGMRINGTTQFEWRNTATGQVVGTTANLLAMPAGSYQLTATSNPQGCTARSSIYVIPLAPPMNVLVVSDSSTNASCGLNNGYIQLKQLSSSTAWFNLRWLKDSVSLVGTGLSINNLSPATYHCIATDTNGCEFPIYKKTITALPLPSLNEANAVAWPDTCEFKTGRITGITAASDADLQYSWRNLLDQEVARSLQLANAAAGTYYLVITDSRGCTARSRNYTVQAVTTQLPAPRYATLINIPRNTDVKLNLLEARTGTFELYDAATGLLVAQNTSGIFALQNIAADKQYYIRCIEGPCSSSQANITIKVFDETRLTIPNAFSPNNDGINDVFKIQAFGYFRLNYLKIYNRFGQMIYESRDLSLGWDGKRNNTPLPVGTYYWLLEGIDMNNRRVTKTGSITLIR